MKTISFIRKPHRDDTIKQPFRFRLQILQVDANAVIDGVSSGFNLICDGVNNDGSRF